MTYVAMHAGGATTIDGCAASYSLMIEVCDTDDVKYFITNKC